MSSHLSFVSLVFFVFLILTICTVLYMNGSAFRTIRAHEVKILFRLTRMPKTLYSFIPDLTNMLSNFSSLSKTAKGRKLIKILSEGSKYTIIRKITTKGMRGVYLRRNES